MLLATSWPSHARLDQECKKPVFRPGVELAAGSEPGSVLSADVNSDGAADLVVTNSGSNNISVFLGDGKGKFDTGRKYNAGGSPRGVIAQDLNSDGRVDLALANFDADNVAVMLGDGSGRFSERKVISVGNGPVALVAGDFDNDGKFDLAVANNKSNDVSILIGDGEGNFNGAVRLPVGAQPFAILGDDVNQDGRLDLITANSASGDVSLLANEGRGLFSAAVNYAAGKTPVALAVLNSGNQRDLAVTTSGTSGLALLRSVAGGFASGRNFLAPVAPLFGAGGDLNHDGRMDVAIIDGLTNVVTIMIANRKGELVPGKPVKLTGEQTICNFVTIGDFNGDRRRDLAVTNSGRVTIMPG
ncbi:MAG TPA: VCBS repeat-containing protein, partial [Pyrinomonadaceae bacterium]|nr:VCBS repeat-containing protein [Pyrinomonadaceae bacterium]